MDNIAKKSCCAHNGVVITFHGLKLTPNCRNIYIIYSVGLCDQAPCPTWSHITKRGQLGSTGGGQPPWKRLQSPQRKDGRKALDTPPYSPPYLSYTFHQRLHTYLRVRKASSSPALAAVAALFSLAPALTAQAQPLIPYPQSTMFHKFLFQFMG